MKIPRYYNRRSLYEIEQELLFYYDLALKAKKKRIREKAFKKYFLLRSIHDIREAMIWQRFKEELGIEVLVVED